MVPMDSCNAAILLTLPEGVFCRITSETKGAASLSRGLRRALRGQMLHFMSGVCECTKRTVMMNDYFLFIYDEPVFKKMRCS